MPTPKEEIKRGVKQFIILMLMLAGVVAATFIMPPSKPSTVPVPGNETEEAGKIYKNGTFVGYSDASDHGYAMAIITLEGDSIRDVVLKEFTELGIEKDFDTYEYYPSVQAHLLLPQRFMENPPSEVEGISGATASFERYRQAVERALMKAKVDAGEGLMDGTFQGRSKADNRGYGIARVTIVDGRISQVQLKEADEKGEFKDFAQYPHDPTVKAYEELPHRFVEKNSPDIDNFTGATHSTDKYKEAVAHALAKARIVAPTPELWDGTYYASSDADNHGYSKAAITVENGKVVDVRLKEYDAYSREKDFDRYNYEPSVTAYRELPWSFIHAQSADIDAVAGATYSSLHYRQATERALKKAKTPSGTGSFDGLFQARSDEDENGYAIALVDIKDGKIQNVILKGIDGEGRFKDPEKYPHEPYRRAAEELPDRFIKANSHEVDGIAGATRSSHQFKEAVKRALDSAR